MVCYCKKILLFPHTKLFFFHIDFRGYLFIILAKCNLSCSTDLASISPKCPKLVAQTDLGVHTYVKIFQ